MKKFKIFITCLFFLLWVLFFCKYDEISISVYWLIGTLSTFFLFVVVWAIIDIIEKKKTRSNIFFSLCAQFLFLGFLSYFQISRYNRNVCQDKFGPEFNAIRRGKGIPEIPANWRLKSRGRISVEWQAKDSLIGHASKRIFIDSVCAIESEYDGYNLKPLHGKSRNMRISFEYARGKAKDSIFFRFDDVDTTRIISRQQADRIFAAEKIKKDY
jgi:hypothetical protein